MDDFKREHLQSLLHNKFVVIIGDSIQRSVYKDLVSFLQTDNHTKESDLKSKGERSFSGDVLLEGGQLADMNNRKSYREVRQYQHKFHLIRFYFVTRVYSEYMESVLRDLSGEPQPDLVVMNSCLWDITRYGPNSYTAFKIRLNKLMNLIDELISPGCFFFWRGNLPVTAQALGSSLFYTERDVDFETLPSMLYDLLPADLHVEEVCESRNRCFIHLYDEFKKLECLGTSDGVHWTPLGHRMITQSLFKKIQFWMNQAQGNTSFNNPVNNYGGPICTMDYMESYLDRYMYTNDDFDLPLLKRFKKRLVKNMTLHGLSDKESARYTAHGFEAESLKLLEESKSVPTADSNNNDKNKVNLDATLKTPDSAKNSCQQSKPTPVAAKPVNVVKPTVKTTSNPTNASQSSTTASSTASKTDASTATSSSASKITEKSAAKVDPSTTETTAKSLSVSKTTATVPAKVDATTPQPAAESSSVSKASEKLPAKVVSTTSTPQTSAQSSVSKAPEKEPAKAAGEPIPNVISKSVSSKPVVKTDVKYTKGAPVKRFPFKPDANVGRSIPQKRKASDENPPPKKRLLITIQNNTTVPRAQKPQRMHQRSHTFNALMPSPASMRYPSNRFQSNYTNFEGNRVHNVSDPFFINDIPQESKPARFDSDFTSDLIFNNRGASFTRQSVNEFFGPGLNDQCYDGRPFGSSRNQAHGPYGHGMFQPSDIDMRGSRRSGSWCGQSWGGPRQPPFFQ